jgi:hypothetical protein
MVHESNVAASPPTREQIAALMPRLTEDLRRLVAIPSVVGLGFPEHTHAPSREPTPRSPHCCAMPGSATSPANLIVMGPGGYRFGAYWPLGLCLVLFGLVAVGSSR